MFCSYTLIHLTVRGYLYHNTFIFAFYYLMVGFGSAAQIVVGSGTNSRNFSPQRKGLVLAVVLLFFGLSGAVLSPTYNFFTGPSKLANFYTFLSILGLVLPWINAIFHTKVDITFESIKPIKEENEDSINSGSDDVEPIIPIYSNDKSKINTDTSSLGMFFTTRYYLVLLTWGISSGSGLMFINNLGELIVSNHGPEDAATYMVPMALLANCVGRIFGGFAIDILGKYLTTPYFMVFVCLGCSGASLLSAFANFELLFVCVLLQGFFLGLSMLIGVSLPMDMFGPSKLFFILF